MRTLSLALTILVLVTVITVFAHAASSPFSGGTGTENDPYVITTAEQLGS